jgi:uncharacterized protein YecE (DUF72 family)/general stress protein 26
VAQPELATHVSQLEGPQSEAGTAHIRVGTAGWTNPPRSRALRPAGLSHLQYYATHFNCVEVNSSFYRPHRRETYARWSAITPADFRFAVKLPRICSHGPQLGGPPKLWQRFRDEVVGLGGKLAVLLWQLPPSRALDADAAEEFFAMALRGLHCPLVCEPRHPSWFGEAARKLFEHYSVGVVAADPPRAHDELSPTGPLKYFRLHGSPHMYYSAYPDAYLVTLTERLSAEQARGAQVWCVFDNTANHAAWDDATRLRRMLHESNMLSAKPHRKRDPVAAAAGELPKVLDLAWAIRVAFLITMSREGEFHARPLQTMGIEPDGTLRFFTDVHSGKAEELRQDLRVGLVYADTSTHRYVAIRGTGGITRDPQRARELWSIEQLAYYPQGPEDERLGLLTVRIEHAEYWLAPGRTSYLVAALKAAVSGVPAGVVGENSQLP